LPTTTATTKVAVVDPFILAITLAYQQRSRFIRTPISIPLPLPSHHPYPAGLSPLLKAANSASAGLSSLAAASAAITSQSIRASVTTTTTKIDLILPHN
jgi:hypothetical protein